jgi:signal transduction histidine kinase
MLRDPSGEKTIEQIRRVPPAEWQSTGQDGWLNLGYTRDTVWVQVRVASTLSESVDCFLDMKTTRIDYMDWYIFSDGNLLRHVATGTLQPLPERPLKIRTPAVCFMLPPEAQRTIYIRLASETAIQVRLSIWTSRRFLSHIARQESRSAMLIGCIAGFVLLAMLFNWAMKLRVNHYYTIGMALMALIFPIMGGYHLWLQLPGRIIWSHSFVIGLTGLGMFLLVIHCVKSLHLKKHMPTVAGWIHIYLAVVAVFTAVSLALPYMYGVNIIIVIILVSITIMFTITVIRLKCRERDAWFYFLGNGLFWIYLWVQMLFYYGFVKLPILPETFGLSIIALSMLLFFITTAQQVRLMRREKEAAQHHALVLQHRMTRELEALVERRTRELEQASNEAVRANQAKTQFFSQISHDLRAPLNWLIGLADSMWIESSAENLSAEFCTYLQHIKQGGYYLKQLLNNVMDISAIEAGHRFIRNQPINICEWSDSLAAIARAVAGSRDIRLHWNLEDGEPNRTFRSDPVKLSQILMNLVHNAIKFTPSGKAVYVTIRLSDGILALTVEDEGDGMPEDNMKLFKSYTQLPKQKTYLFEGVGMGLYIVKTNLDILDARIQVQNRAGGGACFEVTVQEMEEERD